MPASKVYTIPALKRLPVYLHHLRALHAAGEDYVASPALARALRLAGKGLPPGDALADVPISGNHRGIHSCISRCPAGLDNLLDFIYKFRHAGCFCIYFILCHNKIFVAKL